MNPSCGNQDSEYKFVFELSSINYEGTLIYIIFPINEFPTINPTQIWIEGSIDYYDNFSIQQNKLIIETSSIIDIQENS